MNDVEVATEMPRAAPMSSYRLIDEYTPPPPGSPSQHTRQRSLTAAIPIANSDPNKAPKRSNSIKRMTMMRSTLSSSSTTSVEIKNKMPKIKSLGKTSILGKDKDKEDKEEHCNNNNGDNCNGHNIGKSSTLRGLKTSDHHTFSVNLSSSPPNHNSLPMFPTVKEIEDLTFTKGTSRCVLEGPVFGCPLPELLVKESKISRGDQKIYIPYLVENCVVNLLKDEVLKLEGIFRQSGRVLDNQCMKSLYDKGKYVNLEDYNDLYTVAALLKLYLRELPDPLIPLNMYSSFLSIGRSISQNEGGKEPPIAALQELLRSLPLANKTIMKILFALLGRVASLEMDNKMPPSNLAIVIGPNIMWSDKHSCPADVVNDSPAINQLAMLLITRHSVLFDEDDDTQNVTLDNLCQQHDSLTIKFPSFAELKMEEERAQAQPVKKKGFFERLLK